MDTFVNKLFLFLLLISLSAVAYSHEGKSFDGLWTSTCTQTQINKTKGYVREHYVINSNKIKFTRIWYKTSDCSKKSYNEELEGEIHIGEMYHPAGTISVPAGTRKASFVFGSLKAEKGLIWQSRDKLKIRVSRGLGAGQQASMLNLVEYHLTKDAR